jgi:hypothetical protein
MAQPDTKTPDFIEALAPWILTPALFYVGIPVLFVGSVTMFGLAALHPLAAMIVPLLVGISMGASYKPDTFPPVIPILPWRARFLLVAIGLLFAVLVPLADSMTIADWEALRLSCEGEVCVGASEGEAESLGWFLKTPAVVLAPLALLAALTGSRRVAIVMLGTTGTLIAVVCFVLAVFVLLADGRFDVIFSSDNDSE